MGVVVQADKVVCLRSDGVVVSRGKEREEAEAAVSEEIEQGLVDHVVDDRGNDPFDRVHRVSRVELELRFAPTNHGVLAVRHGFDGRVGGDVGFEDVFEDPNDAEKVTCFA